MSRLTPLILLLLVAGLGYFAYQQREREAEEPIDKTRPLFDGVDMRRVESIRLENIERSYHFEFRRAAGGAWLVTDPIEWPMAPEVAVQVMKVVERSKGTRVPEELHQSAVRSLETPRGFLETTEAMGDGTKRRTRVEIGEIDLDGMQVFVRSDGAFMRTLRNVENLLEYSIVDVRAKNLFSFGPREVSAVERIGGWYEEGQAVPLAMRAQSIGYAWGIVEPVKAQGDPALFSGWTTYMASLRARGFVSDRPDPDLSRFGLDEPWLTITLQGQGGAAESLHVSKARGDVFAMRDTMPNVFRLDEADVPFLVEPVTHFYDQAFTRVLRRTVERVYLERGDEALRLSRTGDDRWTVARGVPRVGKLEEDEGEWGIELPADADRVADLLTATENAQVTRFFTDLEVDDFFGESADRMRGIWVEPFGAPRQGGQFAENFETPGGVELSPFHRFGSTLVGGMDPEFAAWAERPMIDFLDRDLWSLTNAHLRQLSIGDGETTRKYERADEHDWQPEGMSVPARDLDPVLDFLVFLRADSHVPEGSREELTDVITVSFLDVYGNASTARIGKAPSGEVQASIGALRAVLKHQDLHQKLVRLLD